MISIFAVLNFLVCLVCTIIAVRAIRTGRLALLPIYVVVYAVTNGFGISFAFIPEFNNLIWKSMYDTLVQTKDYIALCVCTWMFLGLSAFLITKSKPRLRDTRYQQLAPDMALAVSIVLFLLGLALYTKFMFLGSGLTLARNTSYFHYDVDAAYEFRKEFDAQVQQGQGMLMATVASFVLFPLAAFFAALNKRSVTMVFIIGILSFTLSFIFGYALRQKSPALLISLMYVLIYLCYARRTVLAAIVARVTDARIVFLGSILFLAGLSFFYHITEGETTSESIVHSLYRIFLIPVASDQAWFVVYPEVLPYRGVIGIVDTIFYDPSAAPSGVYEVAEIITGYQFSLNASMLAVAWSAAGYFGVALICIIFAGTAYLIDRALSRLDPTVFYPVIVVALPSLLALTSTSFFDFVMKGGFIAQLAIIGTFGAFGTLGQSSRARSLVSASFGVHSNAAEASK